MNPNSFNNKQGSDQMGLDYNNFRPVERSDNPNMEQKNKYDLDHMNEFLMAANMGNYFMPPTNNYMFQNPNEIFNLNTHDNFFNAIPMDYGIINNFQNNLSNGFSNNFPNNFSNGFSNTFPQPFLGGNNGFGTSDVLNGNGGLVMSNNNNMGIGDLNFLNMGGFHPPPTNFLMGGNDNNQFLNPTSMMPYNDSHMFCPPDESQKLFNQNPPQNFSNNPSELLPADENNFINFQNNFMGNAPLMDNFFKGGVQSSIPNSNGNSDNFPSNQNFMLGNSSFPQSPSPLMNMNLGNNQNKKSSNQENNKKKAPNQSQIFPSLSSTYPTELNDQTSLMKYLLLNQKMPTSFPQNFVNSPFGAFQAPSTGNSKDKRENFKNGSSNNANTSNNGNNTNNAILNINQSLNGQNYFNPNLNQNLSQTLGQNLGQSLSQNLGQNINQNLGSNLGQNLSQNMNSPNFNSNLGQNQNPNFNPNLGSNFNPNLAQNFNSNIIQNLNSSLGQNFSSNLGQSNQQFLMGNILSKAGEKKMEEGLKNSNLGLAALNQNLLFQNNGGVSNNAQKNEKMIDMMQSLSEKEKLTIDRTQKIEKYKSKKRNWKKKISYDCRKRVADTRLRIKGRFISKKDSEKIHKLVGGNQTEAFNNKNNLKVEFISSKFNIQKIEDSKAGLSKAEILQKIDEILNNPLNLYNEEISNILVSRLKSKQIIFRVLKPNREELKRTQNRILKRILKKRMEGKEEEREKNAFNVLNEQDLQGILLVEKDFLEKNFIKMENLKEGSNLIEEDDDVEDEIEEEDEEGEEREDGEGGQDEQEDEAEEEEEEEDEEEEEEEDKEEEEEEEEEKGRKKGGGGRKKKEGERKNEKGCARKDGGRDVEKIRDGNEDKKENFKGTENEIENEEASDKNDKTNQKIERQNVLENEYKHNFIFQETRSEKIETRKFQDTKVLKSLPYSPTSSMKSQGSLIDFDKIQKHLKTDFDNVTFKFSGSGENKSKMFEERSNKIKLKNVDGKVKTVASKQRRKRHKYSDDDYNSDEEAELQRLEAEQGSDDSEIEEDRSSKDLEEEINYLEDEDEEEGEEEEEERGESRRREEVFKRDEVFRREEEGRRRLEEGEIRDEDGRKKEDDGKKGRREEGERAKGKAGTKKEAKNKKDDLNKKSEKLESNSKESDDLKLFQNAKPIGFKDPSSERFQRFVQMMQLNELKKMQQPQPIFPFPAFPSYYSPSSLPNPSSLPPSILPPAHNSLLPPSSSLLPPSPSLAPSLSLLPSSDKKANLNNYRGYGNSPASAVTPSLPPPSTLPTSPSSLPPPYFFQANMNIFDGSPFFMNNLGNIGNMDKKTTETKNSSKGE